MFTFITYLENTSFVVSHTVCSPQTQISVEKSLIWWYVIRQAFFYYCLNFFPFQFVCSSLFDSERQKKFQANISFKMGKKFGGEKNVIAIRLYKYLHIEKAFCHSKNHRSILGNVQSSLPVSFIIELID